MLLLGAGVALDPVGGAKLKSKDASVVLYENEVLCYLCNKVDIMPQDLLIKVTSEFYTDKDIESAKNLLFDLCVKDVRNKIRKGADKRKQNIADIVSVLQRLNVNEMPRFVVHDLSRLPAIDLNSVDVTCMTQQLQSLKENGAFNASSVFNLHRDVEEVKDMIVLLTTQMTDLKQEISKNKTSTAPNASNVSSIWDIEAGLETVKQISASKPLPPGKDIGLHLGVPSARALQRSKLTMPDKSEPSHKISVIEKPVQQSSTVPTENQSGDVRPGAGMSVTNSVTRPADAKDDLETWKKVPVRKRYNKMMIVGTSGNGKDKLRSQKRRFSLFVSRLKPDVTDDDVKDFVDRMFDVTCDCEKLETRYDTYSSFKINVNCNDISMFFDAEKWPAGVLVRKFFSPRS